MKTREELRNARERGFLELDKPSAFYEYRGRFTDELLKPSITLCAGVVVHVHKVYNRGKAALLCHIDDSGKVWWSWTHAEPEYGEKSK